MDNSSLRWSRASTLAAVLIAGCAKEVPHLAEKEKLIEEIEKTETTIIASTKKVSLDFACDLKPRELRSKECDEEGARRGRSFFPQAEGLARFQEYWNARPGTQVAARADFTLIVVGTGPDDVPNSKAERDAQCDAAAMEFNALMEVQSTIWGTDVDGGPLVEMSGSLPERRQQARGLGALAPIAPGLIEFKRKHPAVNLTPVLRPQVSNDDGASVHGELKLVATDAVELASTLADMNSYGIESSRIRVVSDGPADR